MSFRSEDHLRNDATGQLKTVDMPNQAMSSLRVGQVIQPQQPPRGATAQAATSGNAVTRCVDAGGTVARCVYWVAVLGGK